MLILIIWSVIQENWIMFVIIKSVFRIESCSRKRLKELEELDEITLSPLRSKRFCRRAHTVDEKLNAQNARASLKLRPIWH